LELAAGDAPLIVASSRCPDPGAERPPIQQHDSSDTPLPAPVHLDNRHRETTADRWYCVMVNEDAGSSVSQFVGSIPPGRAKDHFHHYEEVLVILRGQGRMWAGETSTPIEPGSCIFLPSRQVHCVENTGEDELRLLGVFYPAGSPAVRYDTESPASP
jgi:mannose-6-phosphate isomerase-like protein (cupin superfamily)